MSERSLKFEIATSPLKEAYEMLGATTPLELSRLYTAEDQKLMKSGTWDYENEELVTNKIFKLLSDVEEDLLSPEEKEWRNEIMWFWYHHAISCAIYSKHDKKAAQEFARQALKHQGEDHPNKITKLLFFLVNDQFEDARDWALTITEEPERETAQSVLDDYRKGAFNNLSEK